jgi:hypothetical protein
MRRRGRDFIPSDENAGTESFVARNSAPHGTARNSLAAERERAADSLHAPSEGELESGTSRREDGCIYFKCARLVWVSWI